MRFSDADKSAIEARVAAFEQATGAQAVVSVVERCDSYPEVPWRAFALGAALAALLVWAVPVSGAVLYHSTALMLVAVLGTGAATALLTVFLPALGRWLLPAQRCEMEVRQYAQALFLSRELFATRERSAILVLVGIYERHGVIIADHGQIERLPTGQLEVAEGQLNAALAAGELATAVQDALVALQAATYRTGTA
ncbi:MAG: TPM domain-containing protein, partial [Nevskiales bacterium]